MPSHPAVKRGQLVAASDPDAVLRVRFDGPRLIDTSGHVLAELAGDGHWYTGDGQLAHGLTETHSRLRDADTIEQDAAWMRETVAIIAEIAEQQPYLTSDDVWERVQAQPGESRMMGNALVRAEHARIISPTPEHRPSRRKENHRRPVRMWRSLRHGNQQ